MNKFVRWLPRLWSNWVSLAGTILTTVTGCTLLLAIAAQFASGNTNVYATAVAFLIVPVFFLLGLALIPLGLFLERFQGKRPLEERESVRAALSELLKRKTVRRRLGIIFGLTMLNILLLGGVGHEAVSFMDTPQFCGTVCHSIMQPEYDAYLRSPHARVACVECHIGSGASWAVKSKLDGLRQVYGALTGEYHRPIPTPVHTLRPARDTCEQCHWTAKFHGNRIAYREHFAKDEQSSPQMNVLLLKVGGENPLTGRHEGIHWHVSPDVEVHYEALDDKRQVIGRIQVKRGDVIVAEYFPPGRTPDDEDGVVEERLMDCVDCHNRPTHKFDGKPGDALDWAMGTRVLPRSLPYLRQVAEPVLARVDREREGVQEALAADLRAAYQKEHPEVTPTDEQLDEAAKGLATLYLRNVYPGMKIGWDTYPSYLGHGGEPDGTVGCFRCHDDTHATKEGKKLSQDCDLCHELLAEEEDPAKLPPDLKTLMTR